ncbi:hypothetical protein M9978_10980 [Sphingomonas sp. MG17]|jgi:hypothetical protein|uniref:Uncharacterized protein n=1 Tax=Sphingomonas tagetis TaxID=2949092 RepID=A0A9X2HNN4_9SPHN|nr:hypothetical protein [Sphingomonas tagetis]MCP3730954.1 hypothetical protein [Sphingomonas tagetis]
MRIFFGLAALVLLAGCGAGNTPPIARAAPIPVPQPGMAALTTVLGQSAAGLVAQFGKPLLDVSEGSARKLQFGGPICVLDAYLYPPKSGRGDPTVTFAETRQRDGSPIDQSSCAAALRAGRATR